MAVAVMVTPTVRTDMEVEATVMVEVEAEVTECLTWVPVYRSSTGVSENAFAAEENIANYFSRSQHPP
jgi:hypothetical protein